MRLWDIKTRRSGAFVARYMARTGKDALALFVADCEAMLPGRHAEEWTFGLKVTKAENRYLHLRGFG